MAALKRAIGWWESFRLQRANSHQAWRLVRVLRSRHMAIRGRLEVCDTDGARMDEREHRKIRSAAEVRSGNDPLRLDLEGGFGAESLAQADLACKVNVAH